MKIKFAFPTHLTLLLVAVAFCLTAHAQDWHLYKETPVNVIPKDITVNNAGTLFLLTTNSEVFYKTNGQSLWTPMDGPLGIHSVLLEARCIAADRNSDKVYIGTSIMGLYSTSDFGNTWQNIYVETNAVTGHHEGYQCLTQINNSNRFYGGVFAQPAVTIFTSLGNIATEKNFNSNPFNGSAEAIIETSGHTVLVGTFNTGIWFSADSGNNYTQSSFNSGRVTAFAEDDSGRVYALSENLSLGTYSLIYSDDYQNWNTLTLPNNSLDYTTLFYESQTGKLWLGSTSGIYKTDLSAIQWQSADNNNNETQALKFIEGLNHQLYLFSNQYNAQSLDASSNNWLAFNDGFTGDINDLLVDSSGKLFAFNNFFSNIVASVQDPNDDWDKISLGQLTFGIRQMTKDVQGDIFCNAASKALFRSLDGGDTYEELALPDTFQHVNTGGMDLLEGGEANGIFLHHSGLPGVLFGSSDTGNTWQIIAEMPQNKFITDFAQDAAGNMFILTISGQEELFYSPDNGASWTVIATDTFPHFEMESLYVQGNRVFVVNQSEVYELSMQDTSFSAINFPFSPSSATGSIFDFQLSNDGKMYVGFDGAYVSGDNGQNWQNLGWPAAMLQNSYPARLALLDDTTPCVVINHVGQGYNSGIYYFGEEMDSPSGLQKVDFPEVVLHVYPNPATDILYVDYGAAQGRLAYIVDVTGKIVKTIWLERHFEKILVNDLTKGMYFIRTGKSKAVKFIKL